MPTYIKDGTRITVETIDKREAVLDATQITTSSIKTYFIFTVTEDYENTNEYAPYRDSSLNVGDTVKLVLDGKYSSGNIPQAREGLELTAIEETYFGERPFTEEEQAAYEQDLADKAAQEDKAEEIDTVRDTNSYSETLREAHIKGGDAHTEADYQIAVKLNEVKETWLPENTQAIEDIINPAIANLADEKAEIAAIQNEIQGHMDTFTALSDSGDMQRESIAHTELVYIKDLPGYESFSILDAPKYVDYDGGRYRVQGVSKNDMHISITDSLEKLTEHEMDMASFDAYRLTLHGYDLDIAKAVNAYLETRDTSSMFSLPTLPSKVVAEDITGLNDATTDLTFDDLGFGVSQARLFNAAYEKVTGIDISTLTETLRDENDNEILDTNGNTIKNNDYYGYNVAKDAFLSGANYKVENLREDLIEEYVAQYNAEIDAINADIKALETLMNSFEKDVAEYVANLPLTAEEVSIILEPVLEAVTSKLPDYDSAKEQMLLLQADGTNLDGANVSDPKWTGFINTLESMNINDIEGLRVTSLNKIIEKMDLEVANISDFSEDDEMSPDEHNGYILDAVQSMKAIGIEFSTSATNTLFDLLESATEARTPVGLEIVQELLTYRGAELAVDNLTTAQIGTIVENTGKMYVEHKVATASNPVNTLNDNIDTLQDTFEALFDTFGADNIPSNALSVAFQNLLENDYIASTDGFLSLLSDAQIMFVVESTIYEYAQNANTLQIPDMLEYLTPDMIAEVGPESYNSYGTYIAATIKEFIDILPEDDLPLDLMAQLMEAYDGFYNATMANLMIDLAEDNRVDLFEFLIDNLSIDALTTFEIDFRDNLADLGMGIIPTGEAMGLWSTDQVVDTIFGSELDNVILGQALSDEVEFDTEGKPVSYSANQDNAVTIHAGAGDDTVYGHLLAGDTLKGEDGNDRIYGNGGDDIISGGDGNDILDGGDGADIFKFNEGETGTDTIAQFIMDDGDMFDMTELLELFDENRDFINEYVRVEASSLPIMMEGFEMYKSVSIYVDSTGNQNFGSDTNVLNATVRFSEELEDSAAELALYDKITEDTLALRDAPGYNGGGNNNGGGNGGDRDLDGQGSETGNSDESEWLYTFEAGKNVLHLDSDDNVLNLWEWDDRSEDIETIWAKDGDDVIYADALAHEATTLLNGRYNYTSNEQTDLEILGGNGNDFIRGHLLGNNDIYGGNGDDELIGQKGDDWLQGGYGNDLLTGGEGADTFHIHSYNNGAVDDIDFITDMNLEEDTINLANIIQYDKNTSLQDAVDDFLTITRQSDDNLEDLITINVDRDGGEDKYSSAEIIQFRSNESDAQILDALFLGQNLVTEDALV